MTAKSKVNPAEIVAALRDVTVTYDSYLTRALSRVTLECRRGEVMGILGAKGAGKSTVLKILAGRMTPAEGTAKVFGRSARGGASRARVGYLPGKVDSNHSPGFLGRVFGGKNKSPSSGRGVARLTQAILGNRDLLILDDPFVGLEPAELIEARAFIRDMVARGKTVILSGDSLMEVKDLCERIAVLHEGKVQAVGTLPELLAGGGAIRFLPAILPREIVARVLEVLREEILGGSIPAHTSTRSPQKKSPGASVETGKASAANQMLSPLIKPDGGAQPASTEAKTDDPIDHEKLAGLMKPAKPK
jgi:ABC-2 type transport system ATP-binding protein